MKAIYVCVLRPHGVSQQQGYCPDQWLWSLVRRDLRSASAVLCLGGGDNKTMRDPGSKAQCDVPVCRASRQHHGVGI